jgi:hypothetical protein
MVAASNAQLLSSLIDQLAELLRSIHHSLPFLSILIMDLLPDLSVFPRRSQVQLPPSLELLLTLNQRVEDPFPVLEGNFGPEGTGALIEGVHLLISELAVEDFKVLAS